MVKVYETLEEARKVRATLPHVVDGFLYGNYIRETLDGKFAIISLPIDCYLSQDTLRKYNLPYTTFTIFDNSDID